MLLYGGDSDGAMSFRWKEQGTLKGEEDESFLFHFTVLKLPFLPFFSTPLPYILPTFPRHPPYLAPFKQRRCTPGGGFGHIPLVSCMRCAVRVSRAGFGSATSSATQSNCNHHRDKN